MANYLENQLIINSIIEQNTIKINNDDYYNDVLNLLNLIFLTKVDSILKIKIKKIAMTPTILNYYNDIIELYCLNKNKINIELYNFSIEHDLKETLKIIIIIVNNILEKLNFTLIKYKENNFFIKKL